MAVDMMTEFMTHDEKQFLLGEGFQQRRGKHDVHATIFRLETGGIELRRWIRIKLEPAFNTKTLLATVCHGVQCTRHGTAETNRGAQQMSAHTWPFTIFLLLFHDLTHPTYFRMGQQRLVQLQVIIAADLTRRVFHIQLAPYNVGYTLATEGRFRTCSATLETLFNPAKSGCPYSSESQVLSIKR